MRYGTWGRGCPSHQCKKDNQTKYYISQARSFRTLQRLGILWTLGIMGALQESDFELNVSLGTL